MSYDPVMAEAARAAARQLASQYGPRVEAEVEAALHSGAKDEPPSQFFDPVAVGGLIVAIATLAWTIYNDIKSRGEKPTQDGVARRVRNERRREVNLSDAEVKIIDTVSTEVVEYGDR